ncbi:SDR family oxidoreductase [uncultured Ilyobacter sp.]|uniref:SDR family oxidoreductase n=1 Tax=uncultured Ilyobacter sp. TaxID=544433 RepID=UPI0029BFBC20|nr:SDR family oxidoreductase [uncultured Ilyobacter sp.]
MNNYNFNLNGKVAVITGGGGVINGVFAKALCIRGAKVALFDIDKTAANRIALELIKLGGTAKAYKADVLSKESLTAAYEEVKKDFGTCDILLNGAGVHHPLATTGHEQLTEENMANGRTFFDLDIDKVKWVYNIDFMGTFLPTQVICKDMIGKAGCSVINISSMNAISPTSTVPIYSAAKAGVSNFTAWLSSYFAKVGIRVNALAPGFFVTNLNKNIMYKEDGTLSKRSERIIAGTPMSRFGNPDECVGTLLYLLDPQLSSFVTGAVIPIDGGFSSFCGV